MKGAAVERTKLSLEGRKLKREKSKRGTLLAAERPHVGNFVCMKMNRISSWFRCAGTSCVTSGHFKHCTLESIPVINLEVESKLVCLAGCQAGFPPGLSVLRVSARLLLQRHPPCFVCKPCNLRCRGDFHWESEMRKTSEGCGPDPLVSLGSPRRGGGGQHQPARGVGMPGPPARPEPWLHAASL